MNKNRHPDAFLSYARLDDDVSDGYISWLREELESQVNASIGKGSFWIYQDVDEIKAGDNWKTSLEVALSGARFFIPMMSPSFFASQMCLFELAKFHGFENTSGRSDLIIPVYFRDAPDHWDDAENPHAALLRERQVFDFRRLRLRRRDDPEVIESIERLANDIKKALRRTVDLARSAKTATAAITAPEALITLQDELIATRNALAEVRSEVERSRIEFEAKLAETMKSNQENILTPENEISSKQSEVQKLGAERDSLKDDLSAANVKIKLLASELARLKTQIVANHQDRCEKQLDNSTQPTHTLGSDLRLAGLSPDIETTNTLFSEITPRASTKHSEIYPSHLLRNVFGPVEDLDPPNVSKETSRISMLQFAKEWGRTGDGKAILIWAAALLCFFLIIAINSYR